MNRGGRTEWHRDSDGEDRALGAEPRGERHRVRHANSGLPRHQLQHAALVERRGGRVVRLSGVPTSATITAPWKRMVSPRPSRCSTRTTSRRRQRLRLAQQYFFVSCSLQDMLHTLDVAGVPVTHFAERFAVQLNDTHPSIGVAELMRLLVDERQLDWDTRGGSPPPSATRTTRCCRRRWRRGRCPYNNAATGAPEDHLRDQPPPSTRCARFPNDDTRAARMSLIGEAGADQCAWRISRPSAAAVNGVAALHSQLLEASVLKDFYEAGRSASATRPTG